MADSRLPAFTVTEYETFLNYQIKTHPDAANTQLAFALCEVYPIGSMKAFGIVQAWRVTVAFREKVEKVVIPFEPAKAGTVCRFCGNPAMYIERICQNCAPLVRAVEATPPSALEKIIREVHLARFLKTNHN